MANNYEQVTVTPEIPASLFNELELLTLESYGYSHEGTDSLYFYRDDASANEMLEVPASLVTGVDTWLADQIRHIIKEQEIEISEGNYPVNLSDVSYSTLSAEAIFQSILRKEGAATLLGDEIIMMGSTSCDKLRPDEFGGWVARITSKDIQHMSTWSILDQWRNPSIPSPLHAAIVLEGGLIQNVLVNPSNALEVLVIDYDTEGHDERDLVKVKQSDGSFSTAIVTDFPVEEPLMGLDRLYDLISKGGSHEQ